MMVESEPANFRQGEARGRPIGGNVSAEEFPQALYRLAVSRGFESQLKLSRELGHSSNSTAGGWYRGEKVPTPEHLDELLRLFNRASPLSDEERSLVIGPYNKLRAEGKGSMGFAVNSPAVMKAHRKRVKPSGTPFGRWMEDYCSDNDISLRELAGKLKLSQLGGKRRSFVGLETMSDILQTAPETLGLSARQAKSLADAVAWTIELRTAQGHKYAINGSEGTRTKRIQKELECRVFNGVQAGLILGVSRQRVSQIRDEMDLPQLMTEDDIARMALKLEETREPKVSARKRYSNKR